MDAGIFVNDLLPQEVHFGDRCLTFLHVVLQLLAHQLLCFELLLHLVLISLDLFFKLSYFCVFLRDLHCEFLNERLLRLKLLLKVVTGGLNFFHRFQVFLLLKKVVLGLLGNL